MLQTLDLCNAKTFNEQVQWSFRIFDCDNSKSIGIDEFGDSVRQVWQIFDGLGDEHNPGDCEKVGGGQNKTKYVLLCFCFSLHVYGIAMTTMMLLLSVNLNLFCLRKHICILFSFKMLFIDT